MFNTESTDSLDKVRYCIVFLAQSHWVSKCPLIPPQIHAKLIHNRRENLKALPRRKPQPHRPKDGHSSPSSTVNRFPIPTMKQPRTVHNYSPEGMTTSESSIHATTKNYSVSVPGEISSWKWTTAHAMHHQRSEKNGPMRVPEIRWEKKIREVHHWWGRTAETH